METLWKFASESSSRLIGATCNILHLLCSGPERVPLKTHYGIASKFSQICILGDQSLDVQYRKWTVGTPIFFFSSVNCLVPRDTKIVYSFFVFTLCPRSNFSNLLSTNTSH